MKERKNAGFAANKTQKHQKKYSQEFSAASTARYNYNHNLAEDMIHKYIITDQFRSINSTERKSTFSKKGQLNWTSIFYPSQNFRSDYQKYSNPHKKYENSSKSIRDNQSQMSKQNRIPGVKQNNQQDSLRFTYYEEDSKSDKQNIASKRNEQSMVIEKSAITNLKTLIQHQNQNIINQESQINNQQIGQDYKILIKQKQKIKQMQQKLELQRQLLQRKNQQIENKMNEIKRKMTIKKVEKIQKRRQLKTISQLDQKLRKIEQIKSKSNKKRMQKQIVLEKLMINLAKYQNQQTYEIRKMKKLFIQKMKCISRCKKLVSKLNTQLLFIKVKNLRQAFNKVKLFAKKFDCSQNYNKIFDKHNQESKSLNKNQSKELSMDTYRINYQNYITPLTEINKNTDISYNLKKSPKSKKIIQYQKKVKNQQDIQNKTLKTSKNFSHLIKVANLMKTQKMKYFTKKYKKCSVDSQIKNLKYSLTSR